ncbi:unnamed protein product [Pocillopora meandrina]|uniref:Transposase Helix-turn-helix domain-containing protein n=1 Tax=Pocillopora meandrina TaxID=46732 RepID=A0AAU9WWR3_9CNID|nr:unnamed protein product [Pocillopora meandrina]
MEDSTVTTDTTIITPTVNLHDYLFTEPEKPVEELLEAAQARIEQLEQLLSKQSFYRQLKGMSDKRVRFHTGFSSFAIFVSTFNALRPTAESMFSWSQVQRARAKSGKDISNMRDTLKTCKLSLFDQFYLCITKLRLGTFNEKLASEFDISISTVSRVFISWVNFLYFVLGTIPMIGRFFSAKSSTKEFVTLGIFVIFLCQNSSSTLSLLVAILFVNLPRVASTSCTIFNDVIQDGGP